MSDAVNLSVKDPISDLEGPPCYQGVASLRNTVILRLSITFTANHTWSAWYREIYWI